MSVSYRSDDTRTPDALLGQLRRFRQHVMLVKVSEVFIIATFAFLSAALVVLVAERFVELGAWSRLMLLLGGAAGFGLLLPRSLHRWVWRTRRAKQVAGLLAAEFPLLADDIRGVLELADQNRLGASSQLVAAAMRQTGRDARQADFLQATPGHHRGRWIIVAVVTLMVMGLLFWWMPAATANAWHRFLNPWTDHPRFTFATLEKIPNQKIVAYGEPFNYRIDLSALSSTQPKHATAKIGPNVLTTRLQQGGYQFSVPGQSKPATLFIGAGDSDRSINIIPKTRPELLDVTAEIRLPDYLQISQPRTDRSTNGRFSLLAGSTVTFAVNANRPIDWATLDGQTIATEAATAITPPITVQDEQSLDVQWRDALGLTARQPIPITVSPFHDKPPECSLLRPANRVVLWESALPLTFSASDDFGLRHVGIQWQGVADAVENPEPAHGETILFAGRPTQTRIQSRGVLSPKRENIPPQVVTLRAFTQDYRAGGQRVYSEPQTIHIMSAAQHLQWITEQMKRWRFRTDAIYDRELSLSAENKRLQSLSRDQLASAENLRRLEQQAAAERDNAERLSQAIDQGRQLVQEALRNKNMRADQIQRWSQSLTRLKGIASDRMPSLARRLDDLASNPVQSDVNDTQQENKTSPGSEQKKTSDESPDAGDKQDMPDTNRFEDSMDREKDGSANQDAERGSTRLTKPETRLAAPKTPKQTDSPSDQSDDTSKNQNDGGKNVRTKESGLEKIDEIVQDHDKLLQEFREARQAMGELMLEFENTTFVRRLKTASRLQLKLASRVNRALSNLFGATGPASTSVAKMTQDLSHSFRRVYENLSTIQTDLQSYQDRDPDDARQKVIDEMVSLQMRVKLQEMALRLRRHIAGDVLHRTEFWADTFDRWAEELVPPSSGASGNCSQGKPNLPPSIVLELMRLIDQETQLRDETRSLDQARDAVPQTELQERLAGLAVHQLSLQERTLNTLDDISRLPAATRVFSDEISDLGEAAQAMADASSLLIDMTTAAPTIAAETAALEALLKTKRRKREAGDPKNRPDGQDDGSASLASLDSPFDILQPQSAASSGAKPRDVGAATTSARDQVPERYRSGLDRFRSRLRGLDQLKQSEPNDTFSEKSLPGLRFTLPAGGLTNRRQAGSFGRFLGLKLVASPR